jgi:hypothetical protein
VQEDLGRRLAMVSVSGDGVLTDNSTDSDGSEDEGSDQSGEEEEGDEVPENTNRSFKPFRDTREPSVAGVLIPAGLACLQMWGSRRSTFAHGTIYCIAPA